MGLVTRKWEESDGLGRFMFIFWLVLLTINIYWLADPYWIWADYLSIVMIALSLYFMGFSLWTGGKRRKARDETTKREG